MASLIYMLGVRQPQLRRLPIAMTLQSMSSTSFLVWGMSYKSPPREGCFPDCDSMHTNVALQSWMPFAARLWGIGNAKSPQSPQLPAIDLPTDIGDFSTRDLPISDQSFSLVISQTMVESSMVTEDLRSRPYDTDFASMHMSSIWMNIDPANSVQPAPPTRA